MTKDYAKGGGSYATNDTQIMGTRAEKLFEFILNSNNFSYRSANKKEELLNHYDYVVSNYLNFEFCKIEVKSTKASRRGLTPDASILFLELKSVGGYPGWIYGTAHYIAFQIEKKFILFYRSDLVEYVENNQGNMPIVNRSGIVGTKYGRKGRDDLVAIFDMKIIMKSLKYIEISEVSKVSKTKSMTNISYNNNCTYAQIVCK